MNAIAPGLIYDYNQFLAHIYPQQFFDEMREKTPVGLDGKPGNTAPAILFLVGDKASFIVGETLCVSGGLHMR